jgi:hypothetical protein
MNWAESDEDVFLISALDTGHWWEGEGGWPVPTKQKAERARDSLDALDKRKVSCHCQKSNPDFSHAQPVD